MQCESCAYYEYDDLQEEYFCTADIDQDAWERLCASNAKSCPYFRDGDEYSLVRKQN
ncbi:MAG: hypothetical protein IJE10_00090 [Clostridia bacterium]|nr:hypothetical protein [Clostridia bacterium]